jgi:quinol monooxygenase YgiN
MSVHVATEFKVAQGKAQTLLDLLFKLLPESLAHDGCEEISVRVNQDDSHNIVSFTRWRTRKHYEDYLQWRTDHGFTADFESLLAQPMSIRYFEEVKPPAHSQGKA